MNKIRRRDEMVSCCVCGLEGEYKWMLCERAEAGVVLWVEYFYCRSHIPVLRSFC